MLLGRSEGAEEAPAVLAPAGDDPALEARIRELRAAGRIVIRELPGQPLDPAEAGIGERLERQDGDWRLCPL